MYASEVDVEEYGEYRILRDHRPLYHFSNRITGDGSSGFLAEPERSHLYAGWFLVGEEVTEADTRLWVTVGPL